MSVRTLMTGDLCCTRVKLPSLLWKTGEPSRGVAVCVISAAAYANFQMRSARPPSIAVDRDPFARMLVLVPAALESIST